MAGLILRSDAWPASLRRTRLVRVLLAIAVLELLALLAAHPLGIPIST
jgi:hypothetical protein